MNFVNDGIFVPRGVVVQEGGGFVYFWGGHDGFAPSLQGISVLSRHDVRQDHTVIEAIRRRSLVSRNSRVAVKRAKP